MPEYRAGRRVVLMLWVLLLTASCADLRHRDAHDRTASRPDDQLPLDLTADQLISFGAELARLNPALRLVECHKILNAYNGSRQLSTLLRLFTAQAVTEGCGDPSRTTRVIRAFGGQIAEERLRNMLSYQILAAERSIAQAADRARLERRLDRTRYNLKKALGEARQALSDSRQALSEREQALSQTREIYRQMVSRDAEARELKDKLDALKSIEQDLNDTQR